MILTTTKDEHRKIYSSSPKILLYTHIQPVHPAVGGLRTQLQLIQASRHSVVKPSPKLKTTNVNTEIQFTYDMSYL